MRSITGIEQEILNRLLSIEFEGASEFRRQAMNIRGVEPDCICGCPSIRLFVDRSQAPLASRLRLLPVELFELGRPSGIGCSVLCLLDNDGYIVNLECVYYDDVVTEWPNEVGELYGIQQGNPELLANPYEIAHKCLEAKGMVDSTFSAEDLRKPSARKEAEEEAL